MSEQSCYFVKGEANLTEGLDCNSSFRLSKDSFNSLYRCFHLFNSSSFCCKWPLESSIWWDRWTIAEACELIFSNIDLAVGVISDAAEPSGGEGRSLVPLTLGREESGRTRICASDNACDKD